MPATATSFALYSRAWYGDESRDFPVPESWDVSIASGPAFPALSSGQIDASFAAPIGTERISALARGRRDAVIIVDDLSRPTPAAELIPRIISELHEAGIADDSIRFVVGTGSHRPLTNEEIALKIGSAIASRYETRCHTFLDGDCVEFGNLPDGMPVFINRMVAESDVKICVGSICPHGSVGYGGGAKLIVPGVAGAATMWHFHSCHASRGHGVIEGRPGEIDHRVVAEQAARLIGVDAIVNVVVNEKREIAGLFVGDVVAAHREGARFASRVYGTDIPPELRERADLVVTNCYPLDADPLQTNKALWMQKLFPNARFVAINPATDGLYYHGLFHRLDFGRYLEGRRADPELPLPPADLTRSSGVVIVSEHLTVAEFAKRHPDDVLVRSWTDALSALRPVLPENPTVVVFPLGGLQLENNPQSEERTSLPLP